MVLVTLGASLVGSREGGDVVAWEAEGAADSPLPQAASSASDMQAAMTRRIA